MPLLGKYSLSNMIYKISHDWTSLRIFEGETFDYYQIYHLTREQKILADIFQKKYLTGKYS